MKKETRELSLQQRAIAIGIGLLATAGLIGYLTMSNLGGDPVQRDPIPVAGEDRIFVLKAIERALPQLTPNNTDLTQDFQITHTEYVSDDLVVIDYNDGYSFMKSAIGFRLFTSKGERAIALTSFSVYSTEYNGVDRSADIEFDTPFAIDEENPIVYTESSLAGTKPDYETTSVN